MAERQLPSLTEVARRPGLTEDQQKAVFAQVAWEAANDLFLDESPGQMTVEIYDWYHPRRNYLVHRPVTPNGPILVTQTPDPTDTSDKEMLIFQDHIEETIQSVNTSRGRNFHEPLSLPGHFLRAGKMTSAKRADDMRRELAALPEHIRLVLGDHPFLI